MARRRPWYLLLLLVSGCAGAPPSAPPPAAPDRRPDILFLFADDMRRDALGSFGGTRARTPSLDALVARGAAFDAAYCMGSRHGAVCVPSRAMVLSGAGLHRVRDDLQGSETLPEVLRRAGYRTRMVGKWHNGTAALQRCFPDADAVMLGGMSDHFEVPLVDVRDGVVGPRRVGDRHSSELFADAAIACLEEPRADEAPRFLYVAFTAPHDPRDAPAGWLDAFRRDPPPLPANYRPQHGLDLGPATMTVRDEGLLPWPRPPFALRQQIAEYHGLVAHLDAQIGRVLAALERSGRARHTLVVFAADHGLALGSHGLLGKQSLYEHSMGTPVVIAGPGVPAGWRSDALVYLQDLVPTLCDAAGAAAPAGNAGQSLWPLLRDPGAFPLRAVLYLAYADSQRAVRDRRFKLIRLPQIDRTLLFDLAADPDELHDLAADPAHAEALARMRALLQAQQASWGDGLAWTAAQLRPATVDLAGRERKPDQWQPAWIIEKYFR